MLQLKVVLFFCFCFFPNSFLEYGFIPEGNIPQENNGLLTAIQAFGLKLDNGRWGCISNKGTQQNIQKCKFLKNKFPHPNVNKNKGFI